MTTMPRRQGTFSSFCVCRVCEMNKGMFKNNYLESILSSTSFDWVAEHLTFLKENKRQTF
jgi:hypothetical protein